MAIKRILESPAIARMPRTESTQNNNNTEATSRKGRGRTLIAHPTASTISTFQSVIWWLLIENNETFGIRAPRLGT